jgi:hypothetical protein
MSETYQVLAWIIVGLVVVQAAALVYAEFGVTKYISDQLFKRDVQDAIAAGIERSFDVAVTKALTEGVSDGVYRALMFGSEVRDFPSKAEILDAVYRGVRDRPAGSQSGRLSTFAEAGLRSRSQKAGWR